MAPSDADPELPAVLRDRRAKLERLRADGIDPYPSGFKPTHSAGQVRRLLEAGGAGERVTVAGRLMGRRRTGGISFAPLQDGTGGIQLVAQRDSLGAAAFERFELLDPGDVVGAGGRADRTRRGEPSVFIDCWKLLAKSLRPLPEKWHGLRDVETRYRRRYLDLIANPEVQEVFRKRSRIIAGIRSLLDGRGFLEVETPVLQAVPGGGHARPFTTRHHALDRELSLRIALELPLKRLVVGGFERVYEIGPVFRNEGLSPRHNPEFTMLECYQAYADYRDMMSLTEEVVGAAAAAAGVGPALDYQGERLDLRPPFRRARMQDLVREATGRSPVGRELAEAYEATVEPALRQPTFVLDYPVETSPLARRRPDDPRFAERFELIVAGRETANAFTELADPLDQRRRFEQQAAERAAGDAEAHPFDEDYLRALEYGLPPTGGLGVGLDRLVMLLTDQAAIRDVILFPQLKEEGGA